MIYHIVKNQLIKQMRSYSFLIIISISLFLGFACVPAASDGYQVFYIGGVRGIYNSAWLGGIAAMLSTLLLWLFGFYMLRSQISDDQRLKVGQIIAATPISKLQFISVKAVSNYVILLVISVIFTAAFMVMQLFRGEDYHLELWDYIGPFLFASLPSLLVLATLTVLFDVLPGFKGTVGNIVFFMLWLFLSVISIEVPSKLWDLFGLETILSDMVQEAQTQFPYLVGSTEGGSFGYYPTHGITPTFEWNGLEWDYKLLANKLVWLGIAAVIIVVSSLLFNRFQEIRTSRVPAKAFSIFDLNEISYSINPQEKSFQLSSVHKNSRFEPSGRTAAEIHLMLKEMSIWWKLITVAAIACSFILPMHMISNWLPILMLLPIAIWSQMGTRDKRYITFEIITASCSPILKWLGVWLAGIAVTLLISGGVLLHFILESQWQSVVSWAVGILFVPTLGMVLGSLSGNRKLFEVVYLLWWYMGPFNKMPYLDFLGLSANHMDLYLGLTAGLLLIAVAVQFGLLSIKKRK